MAIKLHRKSKPYKPWEVDPHSVIQGKEGMLPYGRKGTEQGEGVDVRPGTYDRSEINPHDEEDEYPRQLPKNFPQGHLRNPQDQTSTRGRARDLARQIRF
jgi:hypothetical protein